MRTAVIIPCLNEEATIASVVRECRKYLPAAEVLVFDNGSDDATAKRASEAGAKVIFSPQRGKGNAIRHAFRVVDADYVMVLDGDGTYPASEAPRLIRMAVENRFAMVMGSRLELGVPHAFRPLHYTGNRLFSFIVRVLFGYPVKDLLTGQRVFSREFVESIELISRGFEVETELTIRALMQNLPMIEVPIPYCERPHDSKSKLRTFRDGWIIACTVLRLWAHFRPRRFYALIALPVAALGFALEARVLEFLAAGMFLLGLALEARLESERLRLKIKRHRAKNMKSLKKPA